MIKKEMIAMLLAGGQGSRLGVLTADVAKPAVAFGGKYRIIDFPLSNCINSGIDTVGVLTQYQPLRLNSHIGIGIPWDLDRNNGGVTVLPPYEKSNNSEFWINKISRNRQRDDEVNKKLLFMGWTVIRFWGKDILQNTDECVKVIEETIFDLMMEEPEWEWNSDIEQEYK